MALFVGSFQELRTYASKIWSCTSLLRSRAKKALTIDAGADSEVGQTQNIQSLRMEDLEDISMILGDST